MTQPAVAILDERIATEAQRLQSRFAFQTGGKDWQVRYATALLARDEPVQLPEFPIESFPPRWRELIRHLGLHAVEAFVLFAAAAPDLDARYAGLYALLHDDTALPFFSADLASRLAGPAAGKVCAPSSRLRVERLLVPADASAASRCRDRLALRAHPHIVAFAREETPDGPSLSLLPRLRAEQMRGQLADLDVLMAAPGERPVVLLAGTDLPGQREAVRDLLSRLGRPLVMADLPESATIEAFADLQLLARLHRAGLLIVAGGGATSRHVARLASGPVPAFISVADEQAWITALGPDASTVTIKDLELSRAARRLQWRDGLGHLGLVVQADDLDCVAERHRLGPAEINRAVLSLRRAAMRCKTTPAIDRDTLIAAASAVRNVDFGPLAARLSGSGDWDDLVVPGRTRDALEDFTGAMARGATVFEDWGFAKVGRGRRGGVTALFTGASGTGKTMAAAMVCQHAAFEAWRIDLSGMVSKYIGETEKNLERVFSAARSGNIALFFDEADAIFGTRSEVKDAHDRYANIETAYLLQRLEEHDGPVILASNIASNIDQAFLRRLDFVIEFPIPDAALRAEIWRRSLPASAPLAADIDIPFLARQFALAGGDIRAATLDAAFRAARLGTDIDMALLLHGVARQMAKHGRVPALAEFGRYRDLVHKPVAREAAE